MQAAALLFLFFAGVWIAPAQTAPIHLERFYFYGSDHVRLLDWARSHDYVSRWTRSDEELLLTNRQSRLLFAVDSRRAVINGVVVSLLLPIASRNGTVYISWSDVQATLQPILFPRRSGTAKPVRTICLDAGHGGKDPGYLDGRNQEKKYALLLAEEVSALLKRYDFRVVMTRKGDKFIELPVRPEIAEHNGADLLVSLHFNSIPSPSIKGVEVFCMTPAGAASTHGRGEGPVTQTFLGNDQNDRNILLAYQMQRMLLKGLSMEDRGVHRARFIVLRDARMPAVLIEGGFMSNPSESKRIYDSAFRKQMARAIVDGILAYKSVIE